MAYLTVLKEVWAKRAVLIGDGPGQPGPTHWPYFRMFVVLFK